MENRRVQDASTRLSAVIRETMTEIRPRRAASLRITHETSLERDIGLDSLTRLELLGRVEAHFGVRISEEAFAAAETVGDLLRAIAAAAPSGEPAVGVARPLPRVETPRAEGGTPDAARTLTETLLWHAERHGDRVHIRLYREDDEGGAITYGELAREALRIAAGLAAKKIERGEPVAIMLPPAREYFFTFFGVLFAGGVPVPLYPPARPARIEEHLRRQVGILDNCAARILVTVREALRFAKLLEPHVESLRYVVTPEDLVPGSDTGAAKPSVDDFQTAADIRPVAVESGDTALVQYTSGSTGDPKGVVLTHANLLANMRAIGAALHMTSTDVGVSWLPLYHDMGLIGAWLSSLYHASPIVIMSPFDFLARPGRWLAAIHAYRATLSVAPNFAYEICVHRLKDDEFSGLDLSSWRVALNGAEPVNPDTIERFTSRFARFGFKREAMTPVYGLAESSVALAIPPHGRGPVVDRIDRERFARERRAAPAAPDDAGALRFVACGRPLPGHEIRIVDDGGHEIPDGSEGRLQFRGPSATKGYYRNPGATQTLFDGPWLNSGDLAYISKGDVYITGRSKDIIIRAGRNIYPHELESAVGDIPGVRKGNVAVFGSTDGESGTERLVVAAETREDDAASRERIRAEILSLAADIVGTPPDDVVFVPKGTIPKTTSGKVRRAACRDLYEKGKLGETYRAAWRQIARLAVSAGWARVSRSVRHGFGVVYTAYALLLAVVLGVVAWILIAFLPRVSWRWRVVQWGSKTLWWLTGNPIHVQGLEHFPQDRRCIVVSNHMSYLDSFVLAAVLPVPISFVAKSELKRNPVTHHFLRRLDTEFIDRWNKERRDADTRRIIGRAHEGRTLLFFAEGGMSRQPGLKAFKLGAFVAALQAELPLVPAAIRGTRSRLRPDTYILRRGPVVVTVRPAIDTRALRAEIQADSWAVARKLRDTARMSILPHCGEPDIGGENS